MPHKVYFFMRFIPHRTIFLFCLFIGINEFQYMWSHLNGMELVFVDKYFVLDIRVSRTNGL